MANYSHNDARRAELNVGGRTAGKFMPTLEEVQAGDSPEAIWMCDQCDFETGSLVEIDRHLRDEGMES